MIELLLAAERMLAAGELDHAERLFEQVAEADPQNAIAVVGLAEVAAARGDEVAAIATARRALEIDAEEAAARRMLDRLAGIATGPVAIVAEPEPEPAAVAVPMPKPESQPAPPAEPVVTPPPEAPPEPEPQPGPQPVPGPEPAPRRSWLSRLLGLLRGS